MANTIPQVRGISQNNIAKYFPAVIALVLLIALYWGTFTWWWWEWNAPGSFYAHAIFVPFFVAVMIWRDRERLTKAPWNPSWIGMAFLIPAMLLMILAQRSDVSVIKSISFVLTLFGICLMILGKSKTHRLLYPLLFVMMMMPLVPDQLINIIAFPIQMTSAKIATFLLNLLTLHSVQNGTLITMDHYKLAVELPCSGFKTLISLLTFTAAFAYVVDGAKWKRWTLFLTTIPLSILINSLRICFIGIVGELISSQAANVFHDWSGFIVLIMAFAFLFYFAQVLRCESFLGIPLVDDPVDKKGKNASKSDAKSQTVENTATLEDSSSAKAVAPIEKKEAWWKPILAWRPSAAHLSALFPFLVAICAVFALTLGMQSFAIQPVKSQDPISTKQVPKQFEWNGVTYSLVPSDMNDTLTKDVLETLNPTRIISRTYTGSDGSSLNLFITAGNGRKVFHDPHTCMLGSDAVLRDIQELHIDTKAGTLEVLETRFKKTQQVQETEMLICYVVEGKMVPSTTDVRNRIILQTVFGDSGMPSYSFRVTQNKQGTSEDRRKEIIDFTAGIWSQIGPIMKGEVKGEYEPPPVAPKDAGH